MCGVAGIVDHGAGFGRDQIRQIAVAMRDTMIHRGPDDAGVWVNAEGNCALAHRRLSILDLSAQARQPIGNEDGSVQVTFNGEIYNFQELRDVLIDAGHRFRSQTDSEVLPHLFEELDTGQLNKLDGMFGLGVWHERRKELLLARDPFGKKPLYYCSGRGWFAFASELQAFYAIPDFEASLDRDALGLYLLLQYVPAPSTIFANVRKLPAGAYLKIGFNNGAPSRPEIKAYFSFAASEPTRSRMTSVDEQVEELKGLVREAVRKRLMSDVPLGAFLSGGVDSSLVVAMIARELGQPLRTFSIGFSNAEDSEHHFARDVAQRLGTEHHEEVLSPNALDLITEVADVLDEPNGDSSCLPTLLLSRYTRKHVTVALSGDGGDELFGGYLRYQDTLEDQSQWRRRLKWSLKHKRWYRPSDGYLSPRWFIYQPQEVAALLGSLPASVEESLSDWRRILNSNDKPLLHRMRNLDVATYLPGAVLAKVDRMSMQVGLEVRCPLLDKNVTRFAQTLSAENCWRPPSHTKYLLKRLTAQYLPADLVNRRKMGFGLPTSLWSRDAILRFADDILRPASSKLGEFVDKDVLGKMLDSQNRPEYFSIFKLWPLLILELWLQRVDRYPGVALGSTMRAP